MSDSSDSGLSLKDDIASIRTDPTFHDITIVCSDGVEIGACRAILASRSPFFRAMLYGNMREASSHKVTLHNITSVALYVVLQFIHTETIPSMTISVATEVYHAANFLLLPKLTTLVQEREHDFNDLELATSLLNKATHLNKVAVSLPWSENTKGLYDSLLKPFYTRSLAIGDLNALSETALELFLTKSSKRANLNTSEYDLLLCIVEWAWVRNAVAQSASERREIFNTINRIPEKPSVRILLKNGPARALLLKMIQHVNLTLICPHRLKSLTEAVDALAETSPQYLAFCYHACKNTMCPAGHSSELRQVSKTDFQWAQSKCAKYLVISERGTVVECPSEAGNLGRSVRASTPCVAGPDGLCEWDIVVESVGMWHGEVASFLGFVSESFCAFDGGWITSEWAFRSYEHYHDVYAKSACVSSKYGRKIEKGDVITFHLDKNKRTCAMSFNRWNYGVVWTNLPSNVHLYPAVNLCPNAKYRIKRHIR